MWGWALIWPRSSPRCAGSTSTQRRVRSLTTHDCLQARRVFEEVDEALGFRLSQIMWDGAQVPTSPSSSLPWPHISARFLNRVCSSRLGFGFASKSSP